MTRTTARPRRLSLFVAILLAGACERIDAPGDGPYQNSETLSLQSSVPVHLNHAFTVLPPSTYRALRDSTWLNTEFARVEERTTVRPDITYTGVYMLFERTYLEFFQVGPAFPVEAGAVALSDETAGGMAWATERMVSVFGQDKVATGTISRTVDGQPVPWFHFAFLDGVFTDFFSAWSMEFVTKAGATNPPTRKESLASFYVPERLAKNILGVSYALAPADGQKLRDLLAALDWVVTGGHANRFVALSPVDGGARRAVVVEPASVSCTGMTAVAMSMNRYARHTEEMADARLVAGIAGKKLAMLWLRPSACSDGLASVAAGLGE